MMRLVGIGLIVLLLLGYAGALRAIIKAPFRALGILVAGMAVHNFLLMILLVLGTPHVLVRLIQAWKEGILALLLAMALVNAYRAWRSDRRPQLRRFDTLAIAYTAVALVYFLIPSSLLHSQADFAQRVLGLRVLLLIPLLYLFGRIFPPRRSDLEWVAVLLVGSAALVGVFGMVELWFVPTVRWIDWGVNDLSAWLGFTYHGPGGLPENFFQAATEGFLLRRMVSTYVSPLGIAYTGLLIVPIGVALLLKKRVVPALPRWLAAVGLGMALLGIFFSVTRLALAIVVAEFVLVYVLTRSRWLIPATLLLAGTALVTISWYPSVGPLVDRNLQAVGHRPNLHIVSQSDPSAREHLKAIVQDLDFVRHHPLGAGVGSSIRRFGASAGIGESAVFDVFGDIGLIGGLLYTAVYAVGIGCGLLAFLRLRGDPLAAALPLVTLVGGLALIPITLTSDVWSDFSVTFLFWWALGYSVSLATVSSARLSSAPGNGRVQRAAGLAEPDAFIV